MKLTKDQVDQIAKLARLELNEEEKILYAEQLSAVLDYIEVLNEVDTEGVQETCQVTGLEDVVREDIVNQHNILRGKLIHAFPERQGNLLKVQAVFDNTDSSDL